MRSDWIGRMTRTNRQVTFHFHAFKDIRLPTEWTNPINNLKSSTLGLSVPGQQSGTVEFLQPTDEAGRPNGSPVEVRRGWWDPVGKWTPIAKSLSSTTPATIQEVLGMLGGPMGRVTLRDSAFDKSVNAGNKELQQQANGSRVHYGTDIGAAIGTPVFAVQDGIVEYTDVGEQGGGVQWHWINTSDSTLGTVSTKSHLVGDWERTVTQGNTGSDNDIKVTKTSSRAKITPREYAPIGTLVQSISDPDIWYYASYGRGGQTIRINHPGGSYSMYIHMDRIEVAPDDEVRPGERIGTVGDTSPFKDDWIRSTFLDDNRGVVSNPDLYRVNSGPLNNPSHFLRVLPHDPQWQDGAPWVNNDPYQYNAHLHFEYYEARSTSPPNSRSVDSYDPVPAGVEAVVVDPVPSWEAAVEQTRPDITGVSFQSAVDTSVEEQVEQGNLTEEEAERMSALLGDLNNANWIYYAEDSSITNVWRKLLSLTIANTNGPGPAHVNDNIVLTNVSGGLRHVVSSIPLLGHEYPTQQHMGSIEPTYLLEFTVRDDSGDLKGISEPARSLQGMRSILQANARNFRPIPDGWCATTDTFITRLFGTYEINDYAATNVSTEGYAGNPGLTLAEVKKKTAILRSNAGTVPGQPGVSYIGFELQETNPFDLEKLSPKAIDRLSLDEARELILNTLMNGDWVNQLGSSSRLSLMVGQSANSEFLNPKSDQFGQFTLPIVDVTDSAALPAGSTLPDLFILQNSADPATARNILIRDSGGSYEKVFQELEKGGNTDQSAPYGLSADFPGFVEVPESVLPPGSSYSVVVEPPTEPVEPVSNIGVKRTDLSNWINNIGNTTEFNGLDMDKVFAYWTLVDDTLHMANKTLSEHSSELTRGEFSQDNAYTEGTVGAVKEGLELQTVKDGLFGLPAEPKMWRAWQECLRAYARRATGDESGVKLMDQHPTWLSWKTPGVDDRIKQDAISAVGAPGETPGLASWSTASTVLNVVNLPVGTVLHATELKSLEHDRRASAAVLSNSYIGVFPTETQLHLLLDSFDYHQLFGSLLGNSEENQPRAFSQFGTHLSISIADSGFFVPGYSQIFGTAPAWPEFRLVPPEDGEPIDDKITDSGQRVDEIVDPVRNSIELASGRSVIAAAALASGATEELAKALAKLEDGGVKHPAFKWVVNRGTELAKLEYFRTILARIADDIAADAAMLEALGLVHLADLTARGKLVGSKAYPDMELPFHPFFGNELSVDPDFYIWNIYEDGGSMSEDMHEQIAHSVHRVVENCYKAMKDKEAGRGGSPAANPRLLEPGVQGPTLDDPKDRVGYQAEGTDGGEYGPMSSPFYRDPQAEDGVNRFFGKITEVHNQMNEGVNALSNREVEPAEASNPIGRIPAPDDLDDTTADVRMANAEGLYGNGAGIQYPRRLDDQGYADLALEVEKIRTNAKANQLDLNKVTSMFGARQGHQKENLTTNSAPTLKARLDGTHLERSDEFLHRFDTNHLKKLALDSSKDLVSQKMTLKRAYPTFKLFFVEEDEFESRTLNFDDFHSYNAVQSFYVEMSRKMPADHAVITVQNISGTLDGTRRNAIVDLDYFSRDIGEKISSEESSVSGDVLNKDTDQDQPFAAIALRPGLNVQLRCGYSNDPDNLHVMVSGRIADIQWNKNGDLAEILVQSFGTQLVQVIKGTSRDGTQRVFNTTHQLLGSLMLEPELTHFGRWEIGKLFQIGEANDSRLDFTDYIQEGWMGRFQASKRILSWYTASPTATLAAILTPGVSAVAGGVAGAATANYLVGLANQTARNIRQFFTAKKASLFLSPQDDNLFPPHPKDYMMMRSHGFLAKAADFLAGRWATNRTVQTVNRWYIGKDVTEDSLQEFFLFNKKVLPREASYTLNTTTIWKAFHEMSCRHPGWIYGARPYGTEFRYTMFFGVPSQRYWAQGASNSFVKRVNDLHNFLAKSQTLTPEQLEEEYKALYSESLGDGTFSLDEVKDLSAVGAAEYYKARNVEFLEPPAGPFQDAGDFVAASQVVLPEAASVNLPTDMTETPEFKHHHHQIITGEAIKEYLRALNFRFVPFRRYHMFTSERDLVWNGILSAENAVVNAVDVTYFNPRNTSNDALRSPVASAVFQAHSYIPQNQLRIAPVRWPNCKGYTMAMRYGMGELLHRMRDMYRGEIIVLGNPRVRPWDIGILVDSYNDMVGPIEVEQVVHSFSHETGFITEIKPSAVVFGNEISSWPVLEAMKTFSLAVIDIEKNYQNLRAADGETNENTDTDPGPIKDLAHISNQWNTKDMNDLFSERAQELLAEGQTLEDLVFDGGAPEGQAAETLQKIINGSEIFSKISYKTSAVAAGVAAALPGSGFGAAAATLGVTGSPLAASSVLAADTVLSAIPGGKIGAGLAIGSAGWKAADQIDFPGLQWLIGGPLLFLQCLRRDSIIVVPLMKGGTPITAGLSYNDPAMIWSNVRGELRQFVDDVIEGSRDMLGEYKALGSHVWNHTAIEEFYTALSDPVAVANDQDMTGELSTPPGTF